MNLRFSRRRAASVTAVAASVLLVLAGCSTNSGSSDGGAAPTSNAVSTTASAPTSVDGSEATTASAASGSSSATGTSAGAGFPVTIDTAYGEITVDEKPQRIISLSGRHLELLTMLDEKPIAFADYMADQEQLLKSYPWMEGTYQGAPDPALFTAEYLPNAEAVAALDPDLILTSVWQVDGPLYEQLSEIAPTYTGVEKKTNTSWQVDLTSLARLTGHDTGIVEEAEASFETYLSGAAGKVPGLKDRTFQVAALGDNNQLVLTEYGNEALMGLGLEPGEGQPLGPTDDAPEFSQENIDGLTADVVLIAAENRDPSGKIRKDLEADPRLAELPASKNGTLVFLSPAQWVAINGGTATSNEWAIEALLPALTTSALNTSGS